ncbi:MAG: SagB/ThcOx family dehydrogenase [Bacteroidales bacterium]|jgi:SagB-type dehydrogenase family enzyme|nr:SagB/ThcOx family dehydrogenase [Bacteroidales bacterium]
MRRKLYLMGCAIALMTVTYAQTPKTVKSVTIAADGTQTEAEVAKTHVDEGRDIMLEPAERGGGRPLMEALLERRSVRHFNDRELEPRLLSGLLWAANGVNREDVGKRTAPSARDVREIDIYVVIPQGIYRYLPEKHHLQFIKEGDHRAECVAEPTSFAVKAPMILILVANGEKIKKFSPETQERYAGLDCGYVSQNIYLYAASEHLATVAMGQFNKANITKLLNLKTDKIMLIHPIGYMD